MKSCGAEDDRGHRRGGGRGRLGGSSWHSGFSGMVCAAHTHQIATPITGRAVDRGMTSVVEIGVKDSSGQTDSLKNFVINIFFFFHT